MFLFQAQPGLAWSSRLWAVIVRFDVMCPGTLPAGAAGSGMADRPPALTAEVFAGGEGRNAPFTSAALRDGALRLSKCFRCTGKEMAYTMTSLSNVG